MKNKKAVLKLINNKIIDLGVIAIIHNETEISHLNIIDLNKLHVFTINHGQLNTLVNMTKLNNHILLNFNDKGEIEGINFNKNKNNNPFYVLSQAKHLVLLPADYKINLTKIKSIKL